MKFFLICEENADQFNDAVSDCLNREWKLRGGMFKKMNTVLKQVWEDGKAKYYPIQNEYLCQAMVKYEEGEKEE